MNTALEAVGINKRFGAVSAASNVSVSLGINEVLGIIGANGAGKTTFLNIVTGYLKPDSGVIRYRGRNITTLEPRKITQLGIHRSFQIPQIFPKLSVFDNILIALGIAGSGRNSGWRPLLTGDSEDAADAILVRYRISDYRDREAGFLPQGIRKLLDIAMAMVGSPNILLLDEPTSGVSADEKMIMMDTIMDVLGGSEVGVLFVEHDMEVVARYANRVLAFSDGKIVADGLPEKILNDPEVRGLVIGNELRVGSNRE